MSSSIRWLRPVQGSWVQSLVWSPIVVSRAHLLPGEIFSAVHSLVIWRSHILPWSCRRTWCRTGQLWSALVWIQHVWYWQFTNDTRCLTTELLSTAEALFDILNSDSGYNGWNVVLLSTPVISPFMCVLVLAAVCRTSERSDICVETRDGRDPESPQVISHLQIKGN